MGSCDRNPVQRFYGDLGATMKIFLSHSGERARSLAEFLREWLPTINPGFNNVWVDRDSIPPGEQWSPALDRGLSESDAGIICITPESAGKPWPVAEFVCLRKDGKLAVPYLAGNAEPSHLPGPMQAHAFAIAQSKQETWNMLKQLAGAAPGAQFIDQMQKHFDSRWPKLEKFLQELPPNPI